MQATIVWQKIHDAINEKTNTGEKKYRYFVLEGSSRSSKTRSLLQIYYQYAYANERARLSVWRDTRKECKDTVLHDMNKAYPDMERYVEIVFNKTESIFTYPTKSTIEIAGTDEPNKVHGYQGDVIWLNEPYKISRDTFDQLDMRTTDIVFIDWNPKQSHWVEDIKKDPRCCVLHSTFKDNPFCPPEQRKKILSYQSIKKCHAVESKVLTENDARIYDIVSNALNLTERQIKELSRCKENENKRSANDFNWDVYGLGLKAEKPNRIFRWEEITTEEYLEKNCKEYTGVDWGKSDAWGIVNAKYYDKCLYLDEVNYISENKLRETLKPTELSQIHENDEGFVTWYFNRFGIPKNRDIICDTNRPLKTAALRRLGYARAMPAVNKSILDGIDVLSDLRVFFTSRSTNLKYEHENYSRKVTPDGRVLDEPEDLNNHLIDPSRYIALYLQRLGIIKSI